MLSWAFEATSYELAFLQMLSAPTSHALAPHSEAGSFHFAAHNGDNLFFAEAKLVFDRFKGSAVFPGHF